MHKVKNKKQKNSKAQKRSREKKMKIEWCPSPSPVLFFGSNYEQGLVSPYIHLSLCVCRIWMCILIIWKQNKTKLGSYHALFLSYIFHLIMYLGDLISTHIFKGCMISCYSTVTWFIEIDHLIDTRICYAETNNAASDRFVNIALDAFPNVFAG